MDCTGILFRDYIVAMEAGKNSHLFVMHNLNSQNVAVLQFKYFRFECEKRVHAVSREFKYRDVQIRKTKREKAVSPHNNTVRRVHVSSHIL